MRLLHAYNEFTAVAFQFSRIGKDPGAIELLKRLDDDAELGEFIDVLPVEMEFGDQSFKDKWFVVCHNLLFSVLIGLKRNPH